MDSNCFNCSYFSFSFDVVICCFVQYEPHAGDSVLGIVVDSKADVRNFT